MTPIRIAPEATPDLVLAAVCLVLAALVFAAASLMPPPIFDPLGSAAVPKMVAGLVALVAIGIAIPHLRGARAAPPVPDAFDTTLQADGTAAPLRPGLAFVAMAVVIAYPGLMAIGLGFREATILFVVVLGGAMARWRRGAMMLIVPFALVIGVGFGWLFSEVLYVDLPRTRWLPF